MKAVGEVTDAVDGLFVNGEVYEVSNPAQTLTAQPRRMVFVKDTPPARVLLQAVRAHNTLHVIGIPRINLAQVVELTTERSRSAVHLPYEMIIVAVAP